MTSISSALFKFSKTEHSRWREQSTLIWLFRANKLSWGSTDFNIANNQQEGVNISNTNIARLARKLGLYLHIGPGLTYWGESLHNDHQRVDSQHSKTVNYPLSAPEPQHKQADSSHIISPHWLTDWMAGKLGRVELQILRLSVFVLLGLIWSVAGREGGRETLCPQSSLPTPTLLYANASRAGDNLTKTCQVISYLLLRDYDPVNWQQNTEELYWLHWLHWLHVYPLNHLEIRQINRKARGLHSWLGHNPS